MQLSAISQLLHHVSIQGVLPALDKEPIPVGISEGELSRPSPAGASRQLRRPWVRVEPTTAMDDNPQARIMVEAENLLDGLQRVCHPNDGGIVIHVAFHAEDVVQGIDLPEEGINR